MKKIKKIKNKKIQREEQKIRTGKKAGEEKEQRRSQGRVRKL